MGKTTSKSISLLTLGLVCALGVLGSMRLANRGFETNAATVQTHRRVYVYLDDALSYMNDTIYIHYWGGGEGSTWGSQPAMTIVLGDDFYGGMHYFDLPVYTTDFMISNGTSPSNEWEKSDDISIGSLFNGSNYLFAKILDATLGGTNDGRRNIEYVDFHSFSDGQAAAVLNHINSCSTSYAGGYNAWPQINDLFISHSTLNGSTVVTDEDRPDTTISDKCAYLQIWYNIDHGI